MILLCAVYALYVNALPLNEVKEAEVALVSSDLDDDLELAETKHHYKKKQVHYQQQPVYVGKYLMLVWVDKRIILWFNSTVVVVPVKSGGHSSHGGGSSWGGGSSYGGYKSKHGWVKHSFF